MATTILSTAQTLGSSLFAAKSGELASTAVTDTRVGASGRAAHGSFTAQLISQPIADAGSWLGGLATSTIGKISTAVTGAAMFITSAQTYRNAASTTMEKIRAAVGMAGGALVTLSSQASFLLDDGTTAKIKSFMIYGTGATMLIIAGGKRLSEGEVGRALTLMATGGLCLCKAVYDGQELYTQFAPQTEPQGGYYGAPSGNTTAPSSNSTVYGGYGQGSGTNSTFYGNGTFNDLP